MDRQEPHEAFAKLGDETRVEILKALAEAEREVEGNQEVPTLSFSALYDRVDVSNSSRFAYHLDQLTGVFLRKTDDGYTFTWAGERIVRTIMAGGYGTPMTFDSVPIDGQCPECGGRSMWGGPKDATVKVSCDDCDRCIASYPLTSGVTGDRDPDEIVRAVERRTRASFQSVFDGDCPECGGRFDLEVTEVAGIPSIAHGSTSRCRECGSAYGMPLQIWALSHPSTVAFYWERGVDVTEKPFWELVTAIAEERWTVESLDDDTASYRITVREDEDELWLDFDDDLQVTDVRRWTSET